MHSFRCTVTETSVLLQTVILACHCSALTSREWNPRGGGLVSLGGFFCGLTCTCAQSSLSCPSLIRAKIASSKCSGRLVQSEAVCSIECSTCLTWLSAGHGALPNRGEILCFFQLIKHLKRLRRCTLTATGAVCRSRSFSDCASSAAAEASEKGTRSSSIIN